MALAASDSTPSVEADPARAAHGLRSTDMPRARAVPLAVLALLCAPAAVAGAATPNGTFAGTLGLRIPKGGHATVRAVNVATGVVAAAKDVGRTGAFSLTLPPGPYVVRGVVVPRRGRVVAQAIAVSLKPGQRRRRAKLNARRHKTAKKHARAAYVTERGDLRLGTAAVGIYPFTTTATGDLGMFASGFHDLLTTDVINLGPERCSGRTVVREVARIKDVLREFELGDSPYADKSTFHKRNLIVVDVAVRGTISPSGEVQITISNDRTGAPLGSVSGVLGSDPFAAEEHLADQVMDQLCKLAETYEVTLDVAGTGHFATHDGAGTIHAVVLARQGDQDWTGSGPLQWQNASFASKTDCAYVDPVVPAITWSVKLVEQDSGLQLTWSRSGNDSTTASVDCPPGGPDDPDPPPIPGQPGVALLNTGPESFMVPVEGGTQAISGIVADSGDGFFNTGTITVRPMGFTAPV